MKTNRRSELTGERVNPGENAPSWVRLCAGAEWAEDRAVSVRGGGACVAAGLPQI